MFVVLLFIAEAMCSNVEPLPEWQNSSLEEELNFSANSDETDYTHILCELNPRSNLDILRESRSIRNCANGIARYTERHKEIVSDLLTREGFESTRSALFQKANDIFRSEFLEPMKENTFKSWVWKLRKPKPTENVTGKKRNADEIKEAKKRSFNEIIESVFAQFGMTHSIASMENMVAMELRNEGLLPAGKPDAVFHKLRKLKHENLK